MRHTLTLPICTTDKTKGCSDSWPPPPPRPSIPSHWICCSSTEPPGSHFVPSCGTLQQCHCCTSPPPPPPTHSSVLVLSIWSAPNPLLLGLLYITTLAKKDFADLCVVLPKLFFQGVKATLHLELQTFCYLSSTLFCWKLIARIWTPGNEITLVFMSQHSVDTILVFELSVEWPLLRKPVPICCLSSDLRH